MDGGPLGKAGIDVPFLFDIIVIFIYFFIFHFLCGKYYKYYKILESINKEFLCFVTVPHHEFNFIFPDPFFEVLVTPPGITVPIKVYRSEVCKKTLSPKWNPFRIDVELYGGFDRFMKIDCYDWDPDGIFVIFCTFLMHLGRGRWWDCVLICRINFFLLKNM
jgi:hypothetical protein